MVIVISTSVFQLLILPCNLKTKAKQISTVVERLERLWRSVRPPTSGTTRPILRSTPSYSPVSHHLWHLPSSLCHRYLPPPPTTPLHAKISDVTPPPTAHSSISVATLRPTVLQLVRPETQDTRCLSNCCFSVISSQSLPVF
jgi:hypothetical protein